jgi:hypothetical protein
MLLLVSPVKSDLQEMLHAQNCGCELRSGLREHVWDSSAILCLEGPPVAKIIPDINTRPPKQGLQQREDRL